MIFFLAVHTSRRKWRRQQRDYRNEQVCHDNFFSFTIVTPQPCTIAAECFSVSDDAFMAIAQKESEHVYPPSPSKLEQFVFHLEKMLLCLAYYNFHKWYLVQSIWGIRTQSTNTTSKRIGNLRTMKIKLSTLKI